MSVYPGPEGPARPPRASLYSEVLSLSVKVRWALILAAATWVWLERPGLPTVWLLGAVAAYAAAFTLLRRLDRHPPLIVAGLLDMGATVWLLALEGSGVGLLPLLFAFPIIMLVLAYGWPGALLSLAGYLVGESALLVTDVGAPDPIEALVGRAAILVFVGLVLGVLVARHEELRARLARVMIHDRETGLYNRPYFAQALEQVHKLAVRGGWPYSIIVIEVVKPEPRSPRGAWSTADRAFREMATRARSCLRSTDVVARTGDREFAIALPETALPNAETVAQKLMTAMADAADGIEFAVGVADLRPTREDAFEDALQAAYAALVEAREGGPLVSRHAGDGEEGDAR